MKHTTIATAIILAASASAQWTVVNLHPAGATASVGSGVDSGQQVGWALFNNVYHAGLWSGTAGSWVDLHPAGATHSDCWAVASGEQVGRAVVAGVSGASLWSGTAGSWVNLHPAGATQSEALGAGGGQQVGSANVGGAYHASLWSGTAASWIDLHPAGAAFSYANGVHSGQQAGVARVGGVYHASLWSGSAASWVDLNPVGASASSARDNYVGRQAGYADVGGTRRASLWSGSAASWVDLHPAGATESTAYGVHGGLQVGLAIVSGFIRASLWSGTAGSWVDLGSFLPQPSVSQAHDIWQDGSLTYVVGEWRGSTMNHDEAVMWVSRSVAPTSYSMFRGSVFSGNLASLQNSDDNRLVMRPGITLGTSQPPIQIILNATAPTASPNGFSFSLESSASFGNAQQKISLFNFNTGLYEELDARLAKTSDDTVTVTVRTNPSRFIQAGTLAIRALVSFRAVGPSLSFPWSGRIDKVWWNFPG